jgi:peptidoglycan/xylan/chitin deacetylase (PgdA/CDA1 family)
MNPVQRVRDTWRKNAPELAALFNGALPRFVTASRPRERLNGVPVFSYHSVAAETFEADLAFLRQNDYQTLSSLEFLDIVGGNMPVPERAVLLSFDDGPANFHAVSFPLLKKYLARAVAFIAPGLHVDREDQAMAARPMSWKEIAEIHASGLVEFQSHTFESRHVPAWPRAVPLVDCAPALESARRGAVAMPFAEDLARSRQAIEARLPGLVVNQLAFPQYLGTDAAIKAAKSLGFRACYWGLTAGRALNRPGDSAFHISRINDEFLRRLPGSGRISIRGMLAERMRRVRAARDWRRHYARSA